MYQFVTPAVDLAWWRDEAARRNIVGPFVVISAVNAWEGKRWISQRWGELLRSVADDFAHRGIQDLGYILNNGEHRLATHSQLVLQEWGAA